MMMKCLNDCFGHISNENRLVFKSPEGGEVQKAESASKKLADLESQIWELQAQKEAVSKELSDLKSPQRAKEKGHKQISEGADRWSYDWPNRDQTRRAEKAFDRKSSLDDLDRLASDQNETVRSLVASNEYTRPATLDKLADDKSLNVRLGVAKNPSTSPSTLSRLVRDVDASVRWDARHNPNTSHEDSVHFEERK